MQNAFVESFNGTFRGDCLNQHWFRSIPEARLLIEHWRSQDYNRIAPSLFHRENPPRYLRHDLKHRNHYQQPSFS